MKELYIKHIAAVLDLRDWQVENCTGLFEDGATIPFISRYRKERTGGLDEVSIAEIRHWSDVFAELEKRKTTVLETIEAAGALTDKLKSSIENCVDARELEDLYLPFVSKMAECSLVPAGRREIHAREARLCSLNPLGTKAADFVFSDRYGKSYSLYGIRAPYTLLFFSNPGCHACKDIIDVLSGDPGISAAVKAGKLAVLNIYIDSDLTEWYRYMPVYPDDWYNGYDPNLVIRNDMLYNIRAIPSLYLLDEDKRVILKDAPQEIVFAWLANNI